MCNSSFCQGEGMRDFKMKIVELSIGKSLVYKTIDIAIDVVDLVLVEYTNLKQPDSLFSVDGFSNGKIVNSAANLKGRENVNYQASQIKLEQKFTGF